MPLYCTHKFVSRSMFHKMQFGLVAVPLPEFIVQPKKIVTRIAQSVLENLLRDRCLIIIIMLLPLAEGWMQWSFILGGVVTAWWYSSPVHFVLGLPRPLEPFTFLSNTVQCSVSTLVDDVAKVLQFLPAGTISFLLQ